VSVTNSIAILGLDHASTRLYIDRLQHRYNPNHNGYHTLPYLVYQVDFQDVNPYLPDTFDQTEPVVNQWLNALARQGAQHILIPNITLHRTVDRLNSKLDVIHPLNLLKSALDLNGPSIMVIGSIYTMESAYIKDALDTIDLEVISPVLKKREWIDGIRKSVYRGDISEKDTDMFNNYLKELSKRHQVVVACTELSQILDSNTNCIDLVDLQVSRTLQLVK